MTSDLNKRIDELEQKLQEAKEVRYNLQDREDDSTASLQENLADYEETCQESSERLSQLAEAKQQLQTELKEYRDAADDIDALDAELAAANDTAFTCQESLDQRIMAMYTLEENLRTLEEAHAPLLQEFELAQMNEEYTGGMKRQIDKLAANMDAVSSQLYEATNAKYECEQSLFQALKAKQQTELQLNLARELAEKIIPTEHRLAEIDEVIYEEDNKLQMYSQSCEQLKSDIEAMGVTNESRVGEISEIDAIIDQLNNQISEAKEQLAQEESAPIIERNATLGNINRKIAQCIDYQNLYALEEEFNRVGLTIQTTSNNRMVLCKLQNGKAITENVIDDYIFVGSLDKAMTELSERAVNKILDFVNTNASVPSKPVNIARVWRNGLHMYESTIAIVNEDKKVALDVLIESQRVL